MRSLGPGIENEPQWAQHKASFTCKRAEVDARSISLIQQLIVILASNNSKGARLGPTALDCKNYSARRRRGRPQGKTKSDKLCRKGMSRKQKVHLNLADMIAPRNIPGRSVTPAGLFSWTPLERHSPGQAIAWRELPARLTPAFQWPKSLLLQRRGASRSTQSRQGQQQRNQGWQAVHWITPIEFSGCGG